MERFFSNLYRFPYESPKNPAYTYLIVRKQDNLLICHTKLGSTVTDHFNEIEKLGGIKGQFVNHSSSEFLNCK